MSVIRQVNWLSQQRVDVPDLRAIESAVAADFDVLGGQVIAGEEPLVIRGFTISTTGAFGNRADQLLLNVASGVLLHLGASESGTIFSVPATQAAEQLTATNSKVIGSFAAGQTNYIGIDLRRSADASTSDSTKFLDAQTGEELTKTVPKARILDYRIVISSQPFSAAENVLPIAKVVTDSSNNVSSITDARNLMFRLGSGGDSPSAGAPYSWPDSTRRENPITYSSTSASDPFAGGDKGIQSLQEWMKAVMHRLWELGGGHQWYSASARDNVKLLFGQPVVAASGDNFDWDLGSDTLEWAGLSVAFENSADSSGAGVFKNTITRGTAVIQDGQCLYVDLQRDSTASLAPEVADLTSLWTTNSPVRPGARFIIAWRVGDEIFVRDKAYEVGRDFAAATTSTFGVVKLSRAASSADTIVISDTGGSVTAPAASNLDGLTGTGNGTGQGLVGIGGSSGNGVVGIGPGGSNPGGLLAAGVRGFGGTNGPGIAGHGRGNGLGGSFVADTTGGGVYAVGGTSSGIGVDAYGGGATGTVDSIPLGTGVRATAGQVAGSYGVYGRGYTTGSGVMGKGGDSGTPDTTNPEYGAGTYGVGGTTGGGHGVVGLAGNTASSTSYGGYFKSGTTALYVHSTAGSSTQGALYINAPANAVPIRYGTGHFIYKVISGFEMDLLVPTDTDLDIGTTSSPYRGKIAGTGNSLALCGSFQLPSLSRIDGIDVLIYKPDSGTSQVSLSVHKLSDFTALQVLSSATENKITNVSGNQTLSYTMHATATNRTVAQSCTDSFAYQITLTGDPAVRVIAMKVLYTQFCPMGG